MWVDFYLRDNRTTEVLWIMDSYSDQNQLFEVKNKLMMNLFLINVHIFIS